MKIESKQSALKVGVLFGGVSPEHEVSVISSMQAMAALDREKYHPVPVYIAKDGRWYTGDELSDLERYSDLVSLLETATRVMPVKGELGKLLLMPVEQKRFGIRRPESISVDVVLVGLHGGAGENGSIQGLLESQNVPYTGSGVFASALGMDKVITKQICRAEGVPVVDYMAFRESKWAGSEEAVLERCIESLGLPLIVKPARLGSSIGISKAATREELDRAIEEAFRYDDKVIVEQAVQNLIELNCSVLGTADDAQASVLEQPVSSDQLLTFGDKYMRGSSGKGKTPDATEGMASLERLIPAPVADGISERARAIAVRIFQLFECAGVARVDLMMNEETGQLYFNEINTIPGSFSFYLWEPTGVPFSELLDRMIQIALQNHFDSNRRVTTYDVNLLSAKDLKGLKISK
ncbi:MAG: D-alanine--D-alanine ligase [Rhodothermales bacterium]|nr:D-alanine--D-alanine ligase [Rhodothermales bacterium]